MTTRMPALGHACLGLAAVLNHVAWLGWDHQYQYDAQGNASGPYEAWQVIGMALVIGALAFVAGWFRSPLFGALVISVCTTIAWSVDAAINDETGLWLVGAIMLLVGSSVATIGVAALATHLRGRRRAG